jgi:hypothetical protein
MSALLRSEIEQWIRDYSAILPKVDQETRLHIEGLIFAYRFLLDNH